MSSIQLSILIPAYNEEFRVCGTIELLEAYLEQQNYAWEIMVVDDGSQDRTSEVVIERHPEVQVIRYKDNRGKGYATRIRVLAFALSFALVLSVASFASTFACFASSPGRCRVTLLVAGLGVASRGKLIAWGVPPPLRLAFDSLQQSLQ